MIKTIAAVLCALAFLASVWATISLPNAPLYQGIETSCTESGCQTIETTQTLVEANGPWIVNQLIAVTLISGLPLFILIFRRLTLQRWVTWASALLLLAYSIAGGLTIGLFFMPSALLIFLAAILTLFIRK